MYFEKECYFSFGKEAPLTMYFEKECYFSFGKEAPLTMPHGQLTRGACMEAANREAAEARNLRPHHPHFKGHCARYLAPML
jgi:hypothetical protein